MDKAFWHERWESRQIGFHEGRPNPLLTAHFDSLATGPGGRVFVPLCGKSADLRWLREQGPAVLGCELSPIAVREFFTEQGLEARHAHTGRFDRWEADDITLLCGDFFDLEPADLAGCTAVYDRAALIALPGQMRQRYVAHLRQLLPAGARCLLITLDYPPGEMDGPPFPVSPPQVSALFGDFAEVSLLTSLDRLDEEPRFRERGVSRLQEHAFRLVLR